MVHRHALILIMVVFLGCSEATPSKMYPPKDLPSNSATIDLWISTFLNADVATATTIVSKRLQSSDPILAPIIERMSEFTPSQIVYSSGVGHVRCIREYKDVSIGQIQYDALYFAQPLATSELKEHVKYFDVALQNTMLEFLTRFAGSGDEPAAMSGQFAYDSWPTAKDFSCRDSDSLGAWKDAKLLYHSLNGDAVFIRPDGSTAWRVLETDETIPIASTFGEFVELYADFRTTHEAFDSWAFREFRSGRTKR
jgi:hypothetical protein